MSPVPEGEMRRLTSSSLMNWQINADVYYGIEFEDPTAKYSIMIRMAD